MSLIITVEGVEGLTFKTFTGKENLLRAISVTIRVI